MARKTKANTRSSQTKKPAGAKAKSPARTSPKAARGSKRKGGSEVEQRWAEYLTHRTSLETAVTAVKAAEEELSSAREIERARRKEFDDCKASLEQLLEVESASTARAQRRKPFELQGPTGAGGADERSRGDKFAEA